MRQLFAALMLAIVPSLLTGQAAVARDTFFNSGGVRIHYIDRGQGQPIVFLHGYTGTLERHAVASGVAANLEQDHRFIALDLRGHGTSDKPYDPRAYGAQMGLDVVRLLDHLRIERAHIVGYSLGGFIAAWLLTTYPQRFASATLVAGAPALTITAADKDSIEAQARELESDTPFRSMITFLTPAGQLNDSVLRAQSRALAARNDVRALAALTRGRLALSVTAAKMEAVRVPTLGIVGGQDVMVQGLQTLKASMLAMTQLVVVDSAQHGGERGILRRPEFFAALRAHIAANPTR